MRHSVRVNGFDSMALMKLDVLDELDEIRVCTGYRFEGDVVNELPSDLAVLEACEPVYETMPGWRTRDGRAREFASFPRPPRPTSTGSPS